MINNHPFLLTVAISRVYTAKKFVSPKQVCCSYGSRCFRAAHCAIFHRDERRINFYHTILSPVPPLRFSCKTSRVLSTSTGECVRLSNHRRFCSHHDASRCFVRLINIFFDYILTHIRNHSLFFVIFIVVNVERTPHCCPFLSFSSNV